MITCSPVHLQQGQKVRNYNGCWLGIVVKKKAPKGRESNREEEKDFSIVSSVYKYKGWGLFIGKVTFLLRNPNYNRFLTLTHLMWASTHNTYLITLLLG